MGPIDCLVTNILQNILLFLVKTSFRVSKRLIQFLVELSLRPSSNLRWHTLSDPDVGDFPAHGCRLHLLQRAHDPVLLTSSLLHQSVWLMRVKHDVVWGDQKNTTDYSLKDRTEDGNETLVHTLLFHGQTWLSQQSTYCSCYCTLIILATKRT